MAWTPCSQSLATGPPATLGRAPSAPTSCPGQAGERDGRGRARSPEKVLGNPPEPRRGSPRGLQVDAGGRRLGGPVLLAIAQAGAGVLARLGRREHHVVEGQATGAERLGVVGGGAPPLGYLE